MTSWSRELLPALFVANIPAIFAFFSYVLHSRHDHSRAANRKLDEYERKDKSVVIIETVKQWEIFWREAEPEVNRTKVVGFDCEWASAATLGKVKYAEENEMAGEDDEHDEEEVAKEDGNTHARSRSVEAEAERKIDGRVSLIQIATVGGLCGLVRILTLDLIPDSLRTMLANKNVLKLGVSSKDDGNRLWKDHGVEVRGCTDLRAFALRCRDFEDLEKFGLKHLTESVLGQTLDKSPHLRLSDWEAERLTERQMEYAANDALVAIDIFKEIAIRKSRNRGPFRWFSRDSTSECSDMWGRAFSMCQGLVDAIFKAPSPKRPTVATVNNNSKIASETFKFNPRKTKAYVQRSKPLYENCHLMAPDGELLSTCNSNKATWYVEKELGDVVSKEGEQLKVRLRFEPAGRPVEDGIYYIQEKENKCVVCGSEDDNNLRKNIIPQEYRKHFPFYMKDHSSHDVLLMCLPCHQLANLKDHVMRLKLAEMCDAPMGTMSNIRCFEDADLRKVKSYGKAMLQNKNRIPEERLREMKDYLAEYYEVTPDRVDEDVLRRAAKMDTKTPNEDFKPHGLKVIEWMNGNHDDDLAMFEKMWRQHFVDSMKPQFLPFMWSVDHNHKNVRSRVAQGDTKFLKHRLNAAKRETENGET